MQKQLFAIVFVSQKLKSAEFKNGTATDIDFGGNIP
jgi:hypothetical protein